MSGHLGQKQRKEAADRRSQIATRPGGERASLRRANVEEAEKGKAKVEDEEEEVKVVGTGSGSGALEPARELDSSRLDVGRSRARSGSLDVDRLQAGQRSNSERSVALSEQVITSMQVNSMKASLAKSCPENEFKKRSNKEVVGTNETAKSKAKSNEHNSNELKSRPNAKHVLDPSGALCYHWSMVVSFAFLYNFWSLSYRFAFREIDFDTVAFWFALDYFADLIYVLDVVINARTGYLEDGVLQRNKEKIGAHYRECTLFYLDCFCLLPLDILYLSIGFNSILRCTRLVKIYKFWSYVDRTERHTNYPNVFRTFTLVHYILVIFHWNACLFHMISKSSKYARTHSNVFRGESN